MPIIDQAEVQRIADLARLGLSADELQQATTDLQGVLGHFATLQAIDTSDVPASQDVTGKVNTVRSDEAKPQVLAATTDLLAAAPATHGQQVKVPAVFT